MERGLETSLTYVDWWKEPGVFHMKPKDSYEQCLHICEELTPRHRKGGGLFNVALSTQLDSMGKSYKEIASSRTEILGRGPQMLLGICQLERIHRQRKVH